MEDSTDTAESRERRDAARRFAEEESTLRYRLRNQNFCLVVLLVVGVLTVTSACGAIVSAVIEQFWTSINDVDEPLPGSKVASDGGPAYGGKSPAQVVMQRMSGEEANHAVFCFVNYSVSSGSPHRFDVDNVSAVLCDALVFVSVTVHPASSSLRLRRPAQDSDALQALVTLAGSSASAWVCVGGEPSDSADFEELVSDRRSRLAFVHNAVAWSRRMGVAGLLLYWKYPSNELRSSYNTFINTMRAVFERDSLRISVVLPWKAARRQDGYFVHALYKHLDFIVVDTHRTVDPASFPVTTCQSPMRAAFRAQSHGQHGLSSVLDDISLAADHFLAKTMMSVSFASVTFTLKRPRLKHARLGMRALGPGRPLGRTNRSGLASYYDVVKALANNASWHRDTHAYSRCSMARLGDQWIGLEDGSSLSGKRALVRKTAGIAVWDLPMDDFAGELGPSWPLLREAHELVHG